MKTLNNINTEDAQEIENLKTRLREIASNGGKWPELRTEILKMDEYFLRYEFTTELLDYVRNELHVQV